MFTLKATVILLVVVYCRAAQYSYDQENVVTDFKPYNKTWEDFKQKFGRVFSSAEEESYRYGVFVASLQTIEAHNKEYLENRQSFFMGIGPFTDKTDKELPLSKCHILEDEEVDDADWSGKRRKRQTGLNFCKQYPTSETSDLPDTLDWRDRDGVVSPVLQQGDCGSCYAFGATTTLESQVKLKFGKTVRLSQQQFVDCFKKNCDGVADLEEVFVFLNQSGGAWSASDYPYKSTLDKGVVGVCPDDKPKAVAFVTGCYYGSNEAILQVMVAKEGPVWVAAATDNWENYRGGIIGSSTCGSSGRVDHCLSVVGYGTDGSQAYWIVKNSWGEAWGIGGYGKVARNQNFACRIGTQFGIPIVGAGYQSAVTTLCLVAALILALII